MEIRQKIAFQFAGLAAILLLISLMVIYFTLDSFRQDKFREQLEIKAESIALFIGESDQTDPVLFERIISDGQDGMSQDMVVVLNSNNKELLHTGDFDTLIITEELVEATRIEGVLHLRQPPYEVCGFYYAGSKLTVTVFYGAIDLSGLEKLKNLQFILIAVFLFSMVLVFLLGKLFAAKALKPISEVIDQVNQLDISTMKSRVVAGSGTDEIAILANTFNLLLDRLESAIQVQKDFIANSSHELRTPLTVITGQLDVTLLKERSKEEYKAVLVSVLEEIRRLNRLTNKLLILSRAGTDFHVEQFQEIRVDEILWKARAEVIKRDEDYVVNISFDESIAGEQHFSISGNSQLLKTAFINLIENGCKYSDTHETDIVLLARENVLEVIFIDSGIGIPEEEINLIFQPFYRGSNVQDSGGHGIGLSLVEQIIGIHQGAIDVRSAPGEETEFKITLPLNM
jgi:signal transduction histidine kinase